MLLSAPVQVNALPHTFSYSTQYTRVNYWSYNTLN